MLPHCLPTKHGGVEGFAAPMRMIAFSLDEPSASGLTPMSYIPLHTPQPCLIQVPLKVLDLRGFVAFVAVGATVGVVIVSDCVGSGMRAARPNLL